MSEKPKRIQLSRRKGWTMPPNTVKVDRTSGYGNPFRVSKFEVLNQPLAETRWLVESDANAWMFSTKEEAIDAAIRLFRQSITKRMAQEVKDVLRGRNLACWCRLDGPCHADVLLELANSPTCEKEVGNGCP